MRKNLVVLLAVLMAVAIALPAFAVDFKYGGMMRVRWYSYNNFDGTDDADDHANYFDQRVRMYFTFVASENLQLVTKWEEDNVWGAKGGDRDLTHATSDFRDPYDMETKNVYLDFNIPNTPIRAKLGQQGFGLFGGRIIAEDYTGAKFSMPFDPVKVTLGYIAEQNVDYSSEKDNVDIYYLQLQYANGPFSGELIGLYQDGSDTAVSLKTEYADPGVDAQGRETYDGYTFEDNHLFDLGVKLAYSSDMFKATVHFIKNFGSVDLNGESADYKGWFLGADVAIPVNDFTFGLGGFYTTGQDEGDDDVEGYVYPGAVGDSFYWAEIMGFGVLDDMTPRAYTGYPGAGEYTAGGNPSNLYTLYASVDWQALEATKLHLAYYYLGTAEDVVANAATGEKDDSVGSEVDFRLTQKVVDGLNLDVIGAYLFADDAFSGTKDDDDAYEVGARLQWAF
ncbi:hypothetical protein SAMN02746041_00258 [Desulfacinum hydrothermale DSM 13146]|uniref:Alginate export domain-containing protein n=1 Tax=Desulfacinum hydrothermale DSM 13146 TaxID=1121390 RepID=A0A1W1X0I5_9BACT|nr:hypothetical protein [Desulfacinum hydrothermale]SMC17228.1 hypothetical protein SAMN02746041_00258 [Desulfacinum hydrothermale DSM 13146]